MCLLASTLDRHAIHPVMKERVRSWNAGSWGFFWILRDWWPRKHTTAAVKPYSSTLQFLISCVREKKKKTSTPSTVKRLLPVDLSSRKVATLLLTCATVASKRSLFVFTPLVFGVAYNVIDFFLIYHLYTFFFGSSRVRFHIFLRKQRTWPFELKVWFNSPIFAMFKTSSCQESKRKQKRGKKKIGRVSSHPEFLASLYITWLISRAFSHVSLLSARKQDVCSFDTARKKAF